jgi:hypothetical protein
MLTYAQEWACRALMHLAEQARYNSLYLLYWHKSTNTDADGAALMHLAEQAR